MPAHNKPVGPFTVNEVLRLSIEQMSGNGSSRRARQMAEVERRVERLQAAAEQAMRLFNYALPKFNWGASALDAESIQLLNEVPAKLDAALIDTRKPINA
jgi:hypothetical protein